VIFIYEAITYFYSYRFLISYHGSPAKRGCCAGPFFSERKEFDYQ
jgi:hypothetical protein